MADPVAITAIIISTITAITGGIAALHIRRMHSGCIDCDCLPVTPLSRSPTVTKPSIVLQPVPTP